MTEQEHLTFILGELKKKREEVRQKIGDADRDLKDMEDYFWENYTEFDEYGYEHSDHMANYQLRNNAMEESLRELHRYDKMMSSPYFGKITFCYEGEKEPEIFYIGIGNFWQEEEMVPFIYDWRAPVSALFYDYDTGRAAYDAPVGRMKGEILQKMQFKIRDGKMIYAVKCNMKIDDDILKGMLAENADAKLRNIVTTIQKEQNAIIRNQKDKIMVIQGCAGSGKTSIALHRIAYLLYHNRNVLKASNVLILSPNGIFADYISHILPELGEENINEMSLDDFAYHELKEMGEPQDKYDYLESISYLMEYDRELAEAYSQRVREKQSQTFVRNIRGYVLDLESELMNFRDFSCMGIVKPKEELMKMFYESFPDVPLMTRMERIGEYLIDEAETLRGKDFPPEDRERIQEKLNRMYQTMDLRQLYQQFLDKNEYFQENGNEMCIYYEDVYPMLYLKYLLWGTKRHRRVKHLVIDEMQDYSYLQYCILAQLFSCSMTFLGDKYQTIGSDIRDVRDFLPEIMGSDIQMIEITKSYRSTMEIMDFARMYQSGEQQVSFLRQGEKPKILRFQEEKKKWKQLANDIGRNKKAQTIAVLTLSQRKADYAGTILKQYLGEDAVTVLNKDSMKFHTGIFVMPYYLSKGLEFDSVYLSDGENPAYDTKFGRQAIYVSATRALHTFQIYQ